MGAALLAEALGHRLQHDSRGYRHPPETLELVRAHQPGIEVGEQAGAFEHQAGHRLEIGEGGVVAELGERVAGRPVAVLGAVAQGEERFVAAGVSPRPGNLQHLLGQEEGGVEAARSLREGAVVTHVAAEAGKGYEHLAGVAHPAGVGEVARAPRRGAQALQRGPLGKVEEARHRSAVPPRRRARVRARCCRALSTSSPVPKMLPGCGRIGSPPEWWSTISVRKAIS